MIGKLGVPELLIIGAIALLIFGPSKLGELARDWEMAFAVLNLPSVMKKPRMQKKPRIFYELRISGDAVFGRPGAVAGRPQEAA